MANPVAKSKPQTGVSDEPVKNDLYCEKCYDALNYFIDECQTMAPKLSKLKSTVSACKKDNDHYKSTLENLEFDFQEIKAQKEDYEERYNILIKSLQKTNISPKPVNESSPLPTDGNTNKTNGEQVNVTEEPQFVKDLKRKLSEKLEKLDKSVDKSEIEIEADGQVDCYKTTNVEVYNTITLDLNYLTRQFFSETKINSQKILEYFGKKILEAKESDHKRHLEIQYLPSSKKKCSESDIELRKEINDLQMQLKELKAENDKLKCQKNASPSKQDKIVDEYFALEEHESMLKKLNEQIDSLKLQLLESTADHENVVMVLNEELKVVKEKAARVDSLNLEIQDLRAENENQLLVSNENMKNRVTGYETKITDLETEISGLKSKLEAYENEKPTFQEPDVSKWREEISGLNQKITKLETDLGERDQNVQALEDQLKTLSESEQNYQNTLHSNKVLKQLNDTLIADKTNSNTAIQELEDRVDALVAEIDDLKKELTISRELLETLKSEQSEKVDLISSYEVKIVQLENQCKLYEETVVIENTGESTGVSQEQYAKLKSELEYECGVADDLKKQLQVAVDAKADAVKKCESLEDWYKANSVSTDEYTRLTEDCEVVKKTKEVTDEELRVLKEQYHAVEASLNDMKTNGSEATSQLMEERDSLTAKLAKIQSSLDLLLVEKENMVQERDRLKSQLTETTSNFENMSADMSKLMAEREDLTARTEALDTKMVEVEGERDKLKQELGSLTEVNGELSSKHQELENTLNELRASNNDSNAVMTQERDSLKASLEEMNVNLENLGTVRDDLTKQRDELKAKVSELESALERMQSELGALTEARDNLNSDKLDLVNQRDNLLERTNQLTGERDRYKSETDMSHQKIAELEVDVNNYREEVNNLTQTVQMNFATVLERDSLKERLEKDRVDYEQACAARDTLEQKVAELEETVCKSEQYTVDKDALDQKVKELEESRSSYEQICATRDSLQQKVTELEESMATDRDALQQRVNELEANISALQSEIQQVKESNETLSKSAQVDVESNAICLQERIDQLIQVLDKATEEKDQFKVQVDNLSHKLTELETENNNYRTEVQNLTHGAQSNLAVLIERDSLKEQLIESCSSVNKLCAEREQVLNERDHYTERINQLEEELNGIRSVNYQTELKLAESYEHQMEFEKEERQTDQMRREAEKMLNEKISAIQNLKEQNSELEANIKQLNFNIQELKFESEQKLCATNIQFDELKNKYEMDLQQERVKFDEAMEQAKRAHEQTAVKLAELQASGSVDMAKASEEFEAAKKSLEEKTVECAKLKDLNTKILARLKEKSPNDDRMLGEIEALKTQVEQLTKYVAELEEKARLSAQALKTQAQSNEQNDRAETLEKELQSMSTAFNDLQAKHTSCVQELATLNETLVAYEKEKAELSSAWEESKTQTESLQTELNSAADKLKEMEASWTNEQAHVNSFREEYNGFKEKAEQFERENASLTERLAASSNNIEALNQEKQSLQEASQANADALSQLKDELQAVKTESESFASRFDSELAVTRDSITVQITEEKNMLNGRIEELVRSVEELNVEKSGLLTERDTLTTRMASFDALKSDLEAACAEKESTVERCGALEQRVGELEAQVAKETEAISEMVQERDRLKSQLTETTSNFENMSADMSKLMAEREDLTARTEALDTKMVEVEGERDKLKQELGSLTEVNGELSSKHQELENTLNELRASNNDSNAVMTQERDSLKASLEEMNVNLENLGTVRDDLTKQRDELKAKVSELESALERMQLELGALTEAHAKLVEEKGEVATMLAAHDQLVEQNTLLQAGNAELNEELKKWQEEVQILTDTHVAVLEEKDALEQKIVDLETDFETKRELTETLLATRKAEFQKLKEVKNEKIEGLNVKLKEKQADVDKLAETTAELEKQLAALNEELAAKTNGAAEATNKVLEYEKQTDSRVKDLEEENEKFKDDIANYKNMIDSLTTTNNMFTENLDKENQELKQKLDEQMKQSQQFIQDNFEKTKAQTERLAKLESQHNNLSIEYKNLSSMSSNDSKNYLELKQKYDAMVTQLNSLQTEKATLSKKVGESNGLYKLEVANLRTEYASVQSELTLKLKETEERLAASEEQAGQFEKDLKSTLKELSELKSELTSTQEDYEFQKNDWEARGSQQLCALSSKASKFELMYKDEVEQGQALKNKLESRLTEMNEKMGLLTEDNYKLQSLLTNKGAELKKVSAKLNKSCELIKQYEVKLAEQKNQIETSLMKFSEESKNVSAYESNYNLVAEKLKAMNEALIQEKANTGNLVSEMNSLGKEKEQLAKELLEIQRKHCAVLTEKDNLLKDLHTAKQEHEHTLKKHLSQKETLKKEVAELQTKLSEQQAKPNVSFESKMEQKMEKNIQNKLEAMVEQSHKYLNDIENYKAEIVKLKAEAVTEVEKITKSHERLCKEQKDKYNHTLKKHLTEIKKLKESAKEMTETNEFLTEQINNLNKQIYEYSNKENECDSENTTSTKPIHKRLLDLSMNTSMANKSMSDMNQLSSIDMNNRYRKNLENDDSGPSTPARMPMTPSSVSNPMTPSSTMKKQKQCAQQ